MYSVLPKNIKIISKWKSLSKFIISLASNKKAPSVTSLSNNRHYKYLTKIKGTFLGSLFFRRRRRKKLGITQAIAHFFNALIREKKHPKNRSLDLVGYLVISTPALENQ